MAVALACGAACTDLRDFRGAWAGERVAADPALLVGELGDNRAELAIDALDRHGLAGHLRVGGAAGAAVFDAPLASVPGAEADVLAGMTLPGSPLRVYLSFVEPSQADAGAALAVVSLFDDERVELRLLRGGSAPLYGVFALRRGEAAPATATKGTP